MSRLDPQNGLNCQKLRSLHEAMDSSVSYSTSVRPTRCKTTYRGGIAYLCLGIIGLGYSLLIFEFPPVWDYVFAEVFHALTYSFAGMFLVVSSSNFHKRKYIFASLIVGSLTATMCILGAVVAAVGAGYSQTHCDCITVMHGTKLGDIVTEHSCKLCGTTSHLMLYLAITFHCCLQFGIALWVTLHAHRSLRYRNHSYTQQFPMP